MDADHHYIKNFLLAVHLFQEPFGVGKVQRVFHLHFNQASKLIAGLLEHGIIKRSEPEWMLELTDNYKMKEVIPCQIKKMLN